MIWISPQTDPGDNAFAGVGALARVGAESVAALVAKNRVCEIPCAGGAGWFGALKGRLAPGGCKIVWQRPIAALLRRSRHPGPPYRRLLRCRRSLRRHF